MFWRKKNISEPVLSFVRIVKAHPNRFTNTITDPRTCILLDTLTGESWEWIVLWNYGGMGDNSYYSLKVYNAPWLTTDELIYLYEELYLWKEQRLEKKESLLQKRERNRLRRIYK